MAKAAAPAEWLYDEALTAIAAADLARARELLLEVVQREPQHAGAWLDLALLACAFGETTKAHEYVRDVLERFAPPAPIRALVQERLVEGCAPSLPAATVWRFGLALGHDTNVNSGTSASDVVLDLGREALRLPLAPELRPRSDQFNEFWAELSTPTRLAGQSIGLKLGMLARNYTREADYDLQALTVTALSPAGSGAWAGQVRLTGATLRLGGARFMDSLSVGWLGGLPFAAGNLPMYHEWSLTHTRFPNNPAFGNVSLTARLGVLGRHAGWSWRANALATAEFADAHRPGGDRQGGGVELLAQRRVTPTVRLELQARALSMKSRTAYLPPLLATRREQTLFSGRADLAVALGHGYEWVTSWQTQNNRDSLGFLAHRGQTLLTGVVARF